MHPRTIRHPALALALSLAGCGATAPGLAAGPPEAACRQEALASPEVKALMQQQPPPERVTWHIVWRQEIAEAERRSSLDCLRRAGLALPGGVEAPQPRINSQTLGPPLR